MYTAGVGSVKMDYEVIGGDIVSYESLSDRHDSTPMAAAATSESVFHVDPTLYSKVIRRCSVLQ